ncbi:MAG TPA: recombinase family protein [Aeromicrobium sp.]|nr:recombinase family protein [Aeromicrobium sp.]
MRLATSANLSAVIYCRVSHDVAGGRSVAEQEEECRAYCEREGLTVVDVLVDNDRGASRHSRKQRPEYMRLRDVLEPGMVLVTWEASRSNRDLAVYTELRDFCAERGVKWSYGGSIYDLNTSDGRFTTGLHALMSENEAEKTRERVLRSFRANAAQGLPHGKIPYGYRAVRDPQTGKVAKRVPEEAEAGVIRDAARRILAGETPWSVAQDLNERSIPTPGGAKAWTGQKILKMITRPTYAGLRSHHGVITQGTWEPIVSEDDHKKLAALLADPTRRTQRGVEPKWLLSGIAKCGVEGCGAWVERIKNGGYDSYTCSSPKRHVGRRTTHVDEMISEAVIAWCEKRRGPEDLADPGAKAALEEARDLQARLDEAADKYAEGELPLAALTRIEAKLGPKIKDAVRRSEFVVNPLVVELLGPHARRRWLDMPLTSQRTVVRALMTVTILSAPRGRVFDPKYVKVDWLH